MKKYGAMYEQDGELLVRLFDADDLGHACEQAEDAREEPETLHGVRELGARWQICSNDIARRLMAEE